MSHKTQGRAALCFAAVLILSACSESAQPRFDLGTQQDAGPHDVHANPVDAADAGVDAAPADADVADVVDASDALVVDTSMPDAAPLDSGSALCGVWPLDDNLTHGSGEVQVTVTELPNCRRETEFVTTAALRDPNQSPRRTVTEPEEQPVLRTNRPVLDAVFALAYEEAGQLSTDTLSDGAFNSGQPVSCPGGCFQTGELWGWAWTRDTGYAAHLGLGQSHPDRSRNTLDFLLSANTVTAAVEIVQDTGTGGSFPTSTDRLAWSLGARATWLALREPERTEFGDRAFAALRNTLARTANLALDAELGLIRGETSFLDWREQSYPSWVRGDPARIAESMSLSTNLAFLHGLEFATELGLERGFALNDLYADNATQLRSAIEQHLVTASGMAGFVPGAFDAAPVERWDLLATSLAILSDVGSPVEQSTALQMYPVLGGGVPVIWPQIPDVPIYHNRGTWPFVTAYALLAARKVDNPAFFDRMLKDLTRQAALHVSHMENYEAVTGRAYVEDGSLSGPVVNSERQLWSVAGFIGAVQQGLFGFGLQDDGLRVQPYLPARVRRWLGGEQAVLSNVLVGAARLDIVLHLPPIEAGEGVHRVSAVEFDGVAVAGDWMWPRASWAGRHRLDIRFSALETAAVALTEVTGSDPEDVFGPAEPTALTVIEVGIDRQLSWSHPGGAVVFDIVRDGAVLARDINGTSYLDTTPATTASPCYSVQARFTRSNNVSHRAKAACSWGATRVTSIPALDFTAVGGSGVNNQGRFHYEAWGDEAHTLVATFTPPATGWYSFQLVYGNGAGPEDTGFTAVAKRLSVTAGGTLVAEGVAVMPQLGRWDAWRDSTFVSVQLSAGVLYTLTVDTDVALHNMSYLERFATATNPPMPLPFGRVNVAEIKALLR